MTQLTHVNFKIGAQSWVFSDVNYCVKTYNLT